LKEVNVAHQDIFDRLESGVRSYCRSFNAVFKCAKGAFLFDEHGKRYIDLFAGAGSLNYGHNDPKMQEALIEYLLSDGVTQSLDFHTVAKREFLSAFEKTVMAPRAMDYRLLFSGPTGTNAVEAALKIARLATGRTTIAAFTNGYHGVSLGALAATGNADKRTAAGIPLGHVVHLPYDGFSQELDSLRLAEELFADSSSGWSAPAAFIVETIQGEGGLRAASAQWLNRLAVLARNLGSLLIVDDIQAGCGRSGRFFSFEEAGISPDIVCLSKSLSGSGLPLSMLMVRPRYDVFRPGDHNGTFRGNNLAFVTARVALRYWEDPHFIAGVEKLIYVLSQGLSDIQTSFPNMVAELRGRGLMRGLVFADAETAAAVAITAYEDEGIIAETCGSRGEVLKLLPPIVMSHQNLQMALLGLRSAIARTADKQSKASKRKLQGASAQYR
jgi:diaminobutyrate-2-oxoglutarate transaminase